MDLTPQETALIAQMFTKASFGADMLDVAQGLKIKLAQELQKQQAVQQAQTPPEVSEPPKAPARKPRKR